MGLRGRGRSTPQQQSPSQLSSRPQEQGTDAWQYTPRPLANAVLIGVFAAEIIWVVFYVFLPRGDGTALLAQLGGLIALTAVAVHATMAAAEWVGSWLSDGLLSHAPFGRPLRSRKSMTKFKATSWQLLTHVLMTALELRVLRGADWMDEGSGWKAAYPAPYIQTNVPEMLQLYMVQHAVWIYTAFCQLFVLEKQSDYFVMMAHHIVTIGLVSLSFRHNYVRYGLLVLYIHDISDISIDLLKLCNYLRLENAAGFYLTEVAFVWNLLTWTYFRLYLFPLRVIWNGTLPWTWLFWSPGCDGMPRAEITEICEGMTAAMGHAQLWGSAAAANALLGLLLAMHVYWMALFVRLAHGILTEGAHQAGAKEYEGADEDESHLDNTPTATGMRAKVS